MSVLFTAGVIVIVFLWALAVLRRLSRMRIEVSLAWKKLEIDQSNEAIRTVYNNRVLAYNAALDSFPAYLIAPLSGFKPARRF